MSLHPSIYIAIGIIVALSSAFQPQMILFVFIGIGMALYGGVKWVLKSKNEKKAQHKTKHSVAHDSLHAHHTQHHQVHHRTHEQQIKHHHATHHQHHHRAAQQHSQHNPHHTSQQNTQPTQRPQVQYKTCPSCKKPIHSGYRFCPHCGYGV